MAIKIQVEKQKPLEFDILEKTYQVYVDDQTITNLDKLEQEMESVRESDDFEDYRNQLKRNYDALFGEGKFDEIEKMVDESGRHHTIVMLNIFLAVTKEVKDKFGQLNDSILDVFKPE